MDKTLAYLERSKSSPIDLSLARDVKSPPWESFFETIPQVIERLESLSIEGTPGNLPFIASRLLHPAPILEKLSIRGGCQYTSHNPVLTPALFNGELSSLRKLYLEYVRTQLPWRNMVNLTSFTLARTSQITIEQLLNFFESSPQLRKVALHSATLTSGAQNGRLVSPECLKCMEIIGGEPSSVLLDHLLIPVGARLTTWLDLVDFLVEDHLPRSLSNLRNLSNFTTIKLSSDVFPCLEFSGPNGQVAMIFKTLRVGGTHLVLECLPLFDTSTTERLEHRWSKFTSRDPSYRALLPMKDLRVLELTECENPHFLIHALDPSTDSPEAVVCPKLEDIVIVLSTSGEIFDIKGAIGTVVARASRGAKLKSIRVVSKRKFAPADVLELKKHVLHVECGPEVDGVSGDSDRGEEVGGASGNSDSGDEVEGASGDSDGAEEGDWVREKILLAHPLVSRSVFVS